VGKYCKGIRSGSQGRGGCMVGHMNKRAQASHVNLIRRSLAQSRELQPMQYLRSCLTDSTAPAEDAIASTHHRNHGLRLGRQTRRVLSHVRAREEDHGRDYRIFPRRAWICTKVSHYQSFSTPVHNCSDPDLPYTHIASPVPFADSTLSSRRAFQTQFKVSGSDRCLCSVVSRCTG